MLQARADGEAWTGVTSVGCGALARSTALRTALWILLGGWLGSWVFFATVFTPNLFGVLPPGLATHVVGPSLAALHLYGAAAGVGAALLARALGRGSLLFFLPLLLSALCLYSHFGLTPQIAEIRDAALGSGRDEAAAARFAALHRASVTIFATVTLGALALVGLHAREDASGDPT